MLDYPGHIQKRTHTENTRRGIYGGGHMEEYIRKKTHRGGYTEGNKRRAITEGDKRRGTHAEGHTRIHGREHTEKDTYGIHPDF